MRPPRAAGAAAIAASLIGAAALAAGVPGIAGGPGSPDRPAGARAATAAGSGSFTQINSRAGLSIFTARKLAPGASATGAVTVTNAGTLGGHFTLSAADVSDTPGPRAGLLSERLRLAVVDVTAPASPATVYSGALAAMPARALGRLRAGEARTYRFTVTLPDGGPPPSAAGGDNAYAGSSTRVRFVWHAIEAAGPTRAPSSPAPARRPPGDRRAPRLRLSIPRVQRIFSRGHLTVGARCGEPCRLNVSGTAKVGRSGRTLAMPPIRGARGAPGRSTLLRVGIPPRMRGLMRRTLLQGGTVSVRLTVVARDRVGNRTVMRRTVRLRRR
ncbi:MAG: hypothetical protein M3131_03540 [Actinomycetota bacterium]|nr:hypothetical protein [Actinomycetota bacterium]